MNKVYSLLFGMFFVFPSLWAQPDLETAAHPVISQYLRDQFGLTLDDLKNGDLDELDVNQKFELEFRQYKDGSLKSEDLESVYFIGKFLKRLLIFDDSSSVIFQLNRGIWLYRKNLRSPLRISAGQQIFGDASLSDVFRVELQGYRIDQERVEDGRTYLEMSTEDKTEPYRYLDLITYKDSLDVEKLLAYGITRKKPIKEVLMSDYRQIGKYRLPKLQMRNLVFGGHIVTELYFRNVSSSDVPGRYFSSDGSSLSQFLKNYSLKK